MEKEDGQSFSVGELQHPGFPLLVFLCLSLQKAAVHRQADNILVIALFTRNSVFVLEAFLDEAERKYLFECDSEEQCVEWVDAIIKAR